MREIVLDTETTGLSPAEGHRIAEIGAVELLNHVPTGKTFHRYINPERDMPKEAEAVHGLSTAFLKDKPKFRDIVAEFEVFIGDSRLIIHNASFDMGFINAELASVGRAPIPFERVVDTLAIARKKHPMAPNSLDALCRRYGVDNSARDKHGALLDSELLAAVYLELVGGRQTTLGLAGSGGNVVQLPSARTAAATRPRALAPRITGGERAAHEAMIERLGPESLWPKPA